MSERERKRITNYVDRFVFRFKRLKTELHDVSNVTVAHIINLNIVQTVYIVGARG